MNPLDLCIQLVEKGHVFLAFLVICSTYYLSKKLIFSLPNRILRHLNVRSKGWPPAHLDADGDWKPEEKDGRT